MKGSVCADRPLEAHLFQGTGEYCSICRRMRAMHENTGFKPRLGWGPEAVTKDPRAGFNRHPRFFKANQIILNRAEVAQLESLFGRGKREQKSAT